MALLLLFACTDYEVQKAAPGANGEAVAPVIEVDPPALAFDALAVGESAARTVTVSNAGNVTLNVSDLLVTGTTAFSLVEPAAAFTLEPGATSTWTIAFSPANPRDEGELTIESDDPESPSLTVPLTGAALEPSLLLWPNPLDYGDVPVGCALTQPVHLYNDGLAPLVVDAIAEDGDGFTVDVPFALPITIAPGEEVAVDVRFAPTRLGDAAGVLYVQSNDFAPLRTATQAAGATEDRDATETFRQGDGPWERTDVLLYVDNSCSMGDDQRNLADNVGTFAAALAGLSVDWQLLVATRDTGCASAVFDAGSLDADDVFRAASRGGGLYTEAGLTIARNALEKTAAGDCNEGFLRDDAKTTIVLVSDEPEQSPQAPDDLVAEILALAPTAAIHGVVGDLPRGCATAAPGTGYDVASEATGGALLSICDPDWGSHFTTIAELAASGQTDTFALDGWPDVTTLAVTVDGVAATAWTYDADRNAIVFDAAAIPPPGSTITVSYLFGADCEG